MKTPTQVSPDLHVAPTTDTFGGVNGEGGSLPFSSSTLPAALFFTGEYFLPRCDNCSFWGGSVDVHLALPAEVTPGT